MKFRRIASKVMAGCALMALLNGAALAQEGQHYVLDAFGGVHAGGGAPVISPATPYFGFDVAADITYIPAHQTNGGESGILVLDKFGGVHAGGALASDPPSGATPYFGFDAARAIIYRDRRPQVLSAVVGGAGTLYSGSDAVLSATRQSLGTYVVKFDRDLRGCAWVAAVGLTGAVPTRTSHRFRSRSEAACSSTSRV